MSFSVITYLIKILFKFKRKEREREREAQSTRGLTEKEAPPKGKRERDCKIYDDVV